MKKETIDKITELIQFGPACIIVLIGRILILPFQGKRGVKKLWYNLWGEDYKPEEDERIRRMKRKYKSKKHPLVEKGLIKE